MADETTHASRRDRRRAARKSLMRRRAATACNASATVLTTGGLVLTSAVAANASAAGPEQDEQTAAVEPAAFEHQEEHALHTATETQTTQLETYPQDQQNDGGFTTASSSGTPEAPASGESSNSVVGAAYSSLGTPYGWGGTTPAGFDCSGLINWAYEQTGAGDLPRSTYQMEAELPQVSTPEPGDIVLANGSSHAGIYVGNGQVISATLSSGVTLHGMDESWHDVNAIVSPN